MRIVIANEHFSVVGGVETYLQLLIRTLVDQGNEVGIVHGGPASSSVLIDPAGNCPHWSLAELGLAQLLSKVASWMPDLVFCHGLRSAALEEALVGAYPAVLFAHSYYGTCATGTKTHSFPTTRPCTRKLGPMCLLLQGPRRCGGLNPISAFRYYQLQTARNALLARYRAVLVASDHMRQELANHGVAPERLHCIPLPVVGVERGPSSPAWRDPGSQLLYLGRLTHLKGLRWLLSAMPAASHALGRSLKLIVAGSGPQEDEFRTQAHSAGLDVEFIGWVESVAELISRSDLLVVPSVWPEPFGLVGLQAACLGVPTVAFRVGGIADWLIPGQTGEVAPDPPTAPELAKAVTRALGDATHYNALRRGAWGYSKHFSLEQHVTRLTSILQGLSLQSLTS